MGLPNFTGAWTLSREESEFGFPGPPRSREDTIVHEEPRIRILTRQRDSNGTATVERDLVLGGETVRVEIHGREREIRAAWDHETLVVETISTVSGNRRRIVDRWTLDPDGMSISIERRHEQPGGDLRQRLVMRRR